MLVHAILGFFLIAGALGVVCFSQPVHSGLSFLLSLLSLAVIYIDLHAPFIGVMQVMIYAGAILVTFMFIIVLFQDAHRGIEKHKPFTPTSIVVAALAALVSALSYLGGKLYQHELPRAAPDADYGSVRGLGFEIYTDFFFPFEAVVVMFLVALVGALYIGKKV